MRIVAVLILVLSSLSVSGQESEDNRALIVIDIQDFYFPEGNVPLSNPEIAASNAFKLISEFRDKGQPVVYIKHKYEPGGSINSIVNPTKGEMVITKSEVSSFKGTDLDDYLKGLNINHIVICGMQTHMCVEAATRAGSDLGYNCTLVEDACATRDLKYDEKIINADDVHYSTLSTLRSYAKIVTTEEYLSKE